MREGRSAADVADRLACALATVYQWVHRCNASGCTTLERPTNLTGRVPIARAPQLRALVDVALSSPLERGLSFATWSVASLGAYGRADGLLPAISDEWVRRLHRTPLFTWTNASRLYTIKSVATGQPLERIEEDTNRNFWLEAKDAIEYGIAGKIITSIKDVR